MVVDNKTVNISDLSEDHLNENLKEHHAEDSHIEDGPLKNHSSEKNHADDDTILDFGCEYSSNLPAVLKQLNIALAFTSYQAGRLMIVRSDGEQIDVNYKSFHRPMGLVASEDGFTLGTFTSVINFHRADALVEKLKTPLMPIEHDITAPRIKPKEAQARDSLEGQRTEPHAEAETPQAAQNETDQNNEKNKQSLTYSKQLHAPVDNRVDSCFIARSSHYTGMINLHDIEWGEEGLWVVNSSFSCLCTLDPDYSFVPRWKPHFISELVPEDRCHLNGMTLKDGKPAYVTTFSTYDEVGQWRKGDKFQGTLMDVEQNEILLNGLTMPHSPRWHNEKVYFCNSGLGLFCSYDPTTGQDETIAELQGFTRGVDFYGSLAFVGLSKARSGNITNAPPLATKYNETFSGIWVINLSDKAVVGYIKFTGNVDQIYDVAVIPDCSFPEFLEPSSPRMRNHFCIPA